MKVILPPLLEKNPTQADLTSEIASSPQPIGPNIGVDAATFEAYLRRYQSFDSQMAFAYFQEGLDLCIANKNEGEAHHMLLNMCKLKGLMVPGTPTSPIPLSGKFQFTNKHFPMEGIEGTEGEDEALPSPSVNAFRRETWDTSDNADDDDEDEDDLEPSDIVIFDGKPIPYEEFGLRTAYAYFEDMRVKTTLAKDYTNLRLCLCHLCHIRDIYPETPYKKKKYTKLVPKELKKIVLRKHNGRLRPKLKKESNRPLPNKETEKETNMSKKATHKSSRSSLDEKKFPVPEHYPADHPHRAPSMYEGDGVRITETNEVIFYPGQLNDREKEWLLLKNKILTENAARMLRLADHRENNSKYPKGRDGQTGILGKEEDILLKDFIWKPDPLPPCHPDASSLSYIEKDWLAPRGETSMTMRPPLPRAYRDSTKDFSKESEEKTIKHPDGTIVSYATEAGIIRAYADCLLDLNQYEKNDPILETHIDGEKKEELQKALEDLPLDRVKSQGREEEAYLTKMESVYAFIDDSPFSDLPLAAGYEMLPPYLRIIPSWAVKYIWELLNSSNIFGEIKRE